MKTSLFPSLPPKTRGGGVGGVGAQFFRGGRRHPHSVNRRHHPPPPPHPHPRPTPPHRLSFWLALVLTPPTFHKNSAEQAGIDLSTMLQRGRRLEPEALKFKVKGALGSRGLGFRGRFRA